MYTARLHTLDLSSKVSRCGHAFSGIIGKMAQKTMFSDLVFRATAHNRLFTRLIANSVGASVSDRMCSSTSCGRLSSLLKAPNEYMIVRCISAVPFAEHTSKLFT
jgi:hypothetical protein